MKRLALVGLLSLAAYGTVLTVHAESEANMPLDAQVCGLAAVECPNEPKAPPSPVQTAKKAPVRAVRATISTYQAVLGQTDSFPCSGALGGINFCTTKNNIVANNALPLGSKVKIRGVEYLVADRMNRRYGANHFDILTRGENYLLKNELVEL